MKKLLLAFALCAMTAVAGAQTQKVSVLEYCPAPGQFVNVLPEVEEGMTREQVLKACEEQLAKKGYLVHLGSFGGYIDWRFAGCWGVKVGATAQQSIFSGRHEVRPTVIPYFHLGPGADIGVDVGGILYELLRSNSHRGPVNPTVGPFKPGPPPVGPRN